MTNETTAFLQAGGAAGAAVARDADRAVDELARMVAIDTSFQPGRGYPQFAKPREDLGGPGRPDRNGHGPDEHTTVDDIAALARSVLAYLAADFAADLSPDRASPPPRSLA